MVPRRRIQVNRTCAGCGSVYGIWPSRLRMSKFCCASCKHSWMRGRQRGR
jgi:hypothetical protein